MFGGATQTGYGPVESLFSIDARLGERRALFAMDRVRRNPALIVVCDRRDRSRFGGAWVDACDGAPVAAARVAWCGLLLYAAASSHLPAVSRLRRLGVFPFPVAGSPGGAGPGEPLSSPRSVAARRLPLRGLAVLLAAVLLASWGVGRARGLGAFQLRYSEHRYLDVAEFVRALPPDAVFVTLQYSGSLCGTADRQPCCDGTGSMQARSIGAIAHLSETGRPVFGVFDDWELPQVRERFTGTQLRPTPDLADLRGRHGRTEARAQIYAISGTTASAAEAGERERAPAAGAQLSLPRHHRHDSRRRARAFQLAMAACASNSA